MRRFVFSSIRHVSLTLVLAEGGEAGDAGHVLIVRTRRHVPQRLQLPLRAVVAHVAVEHRGWGHEVSTWYCDKLGEYYRIHVSPRVVGNKDIHCSRFIHVRHVG